MDVYFCINDINVKPNCPLNKACKASDCFGRSLLKKCKYFGDFHLVSLNPYTCYVSCNYFPNDGQLVINFNENE